MSKVIVNDWHPGSLGKKQVCTSVIDSVEYYNVYTQQYDTSLTNQNLNNSSLINTIIMPLLVY